MAARLATADQREMPRDRAVPDTEPLHAQIVVQRGLKTRRPGCSTSRPSTAPQLARITVRQKTGRSPRSGPGSPPR